MSDVPKAMIQPAVNEFRRKANGQVVLVLQGGGALGAYQVGVYQALHEAGRRVRTLVTPTARSRPVR